MRIIEFIKKQATLLVKEPKKFFMQEIIIYIIVGALTTFLNIAVFVICDALFKMMLPEAISNNSWAIAEVIAFIVAVVFAFIGDKIIVFKSKTRDIKNIIKEFVEFVSVRIITELIVIAVMGLFINILGIKDIIAKISTMIINIVLNYLASKFIIFKSASK